MLYRIALALVTVFWLAMNYLLWRSEFGGRNDVGNNVPLEVVWRKMLTAPDNSSLDILHHGKKAGYCHWEPGFGSGNGIIVEPMSRETPPAPGLEPQKEGYRLNLEGNVALGDASQRIHFGFVILLATNRAWQEFNLRLNAQKSVLTVRSLAAEQKLRLFVDNEDEKLERVLSFASLENPVALAQELKLPIPVEMLGAAGLAGGRPAAAAGAGLSWEARNDWITVGHTSLRVYRLRARLFDRREIVVLVSPVGEILRVELPDDWVLLNDQLGVL